MAIHFVACIGDSITYTGPTRADIPYPHKVELLLGSGNAAANHGVLSDQTSGMATRWTTNIKGKGYTHLAYLGGVNDIIAGVDSSTIFANIETVVDDALSDGLTVILMTILPAGHYASWTATMQTKIESVNTSIKAKTATNLIIVDTYSLFEDPSNATYLNSMYDEGDHLHPNQAGSNLLAQSVFDQI